uniref:Uncharacterized protein n=1 Tax=Anguilla anguilla TaxID=7936 RepID=A0A0E9SLP1_ANGAN
MTSRSSIGWSTGPSSRRPSRGGVSKNQKRKPWK